MPTSEFCEALIKNDGENDPSGDDWAGLQSNRRKAWFKTFDEILYNFEWKNDDKVTDKRTDKERGLNDGAFLYGCEGYMMYKRHPVKEDICTGRADRFVNNIPIMRYAEVLLLFAEAAVRSNQYPTETLKALNDIQTRAHGGNGHMTTAATLNLVEVKTEKRYEMWLEGVRGFDLIRWENDPDDIKASVVLKNKGDKLPTFRENFTTDHGVWDKGPNFVRVISGTDADGKDIIVSEETPKGSDNNWMVVWQDFNKGDCGWKDKHERFPYPFYATSLNPKFVQNP
jgi:hypothetical protein